LIGRIRRGDRRRRQEGQSLVEFSLIVIVFLLLLTSMMEFGFLFDEHMTLETSTREGARVGSALTNGGGTLGCGSGQSPSWAQVDPQIIAAVERVLTSQGSRIDLSQVTQIKIYKVKLITSGVTDTTGDQDTTFANIWNYNLGGGPTIDGAPLNFSQTSAAWTACNRSNGAPPDSIGVSITYNYRMVTPFPAMLAFFGGGPAQIPITDRSVMAMNPS
jgi:hypothetical protein